MRSKTYSVYSPPGIAVSSPSKRS